MSNASGQCEPVIQLKDVKKTYPSGDRDIEILKGISFQVKKGEFLSITGPSGAGKSTLLHLLGCMDQPSSGSYILNGNDVGLLDDHHLSSLRATSIGFVFQSFNVIEQLNVYENVEVPFFYQNNFNPAQQRERIIHCIELVGLSDRMQNKPSQLSGGEIQRIAIARALAIDPVLVLADEPTGNLDSKTGNAILKLFQKLNDRGTTLMIVTHNEQVAKASKRQVALHDGNIQNDQRRTL